MDARTRVLQLLKGLAEDDEAVHVEDLAREAGLGGDELIEVLEGLQESGLCLFGEGEGPPLPLVTDAGRQWLDGYRPGDTVLFFLPGFVDDLRARDALVAATRTLSDEFSGALAAGDGVGYAQQIVPDAFVPAVDALLATRLFAALIAVIARLALQHPATCVAEELMAVGLIAEATSALQDQAATGQVTTGEFEAARAAMPGIFDLFGDDDVLMMFDMSEPADAALSGHDPANRELGVVDQRIESWFDAFGGEGALGHVREPAS